MIFVSDDRALPARGCDAVSVFSATDGSALHRGNTIVSPGQLAITADGSKVFAPSINGEHFTYGLFSDVTRGWTTRRLPYFGLQGAPALVSPHNDSVFIATDRSIQRVAVDDLADGGSVVALAESPRIVAATLLEVEDLLLATDAANRTVRSFDALTLEENAPPIPYRGPVGDVASRVKRTFATVSRSGAFLIVNGGNTRVLTLVDRANSSSRVVSADGLSESWGVRFNYQSDVDELVVNGRSAIAVYLLNSAAELHLVAREPVPSQLDIYEEPAGYARLGAVAWLGRGDGVVGAVGSSGGQFRVLGYDRSDADPLQPRFDLLTCEGDDDRMPVDVVTLNDRLPSPSPTGPSATATVSPSPTITATPLVTASQTVAPNPSATRSRLFLPNVLWERCRPAERHADVGLVLDASSSMRLEAKPGLTRWEAAVKAASRYIDLMEVGDQTAIVWFNDEAGVEQGLTADKTALRAALDRIRTAEFTRVSIGIRTAAEELGGANHIASNRKVMILLTDGKANPESPADGLAAAAEFKASDGALFVVGLGTPDALDDSVLAEMATRREYYYRTNDAAALEAIYESISKVIPCFPVRIWGYLSMRGGAGDVHKAVVDAARVRRSQALSHGPLERDGGAVKVFASPDTAPAAN